MTEIKGQDNNNAPRTWVNVFLLTVPATIIAVIVAIEPLFRFASNGDSAGLGGLILFPMIFFQLLYWVFFLFILLTKKKVTWVLLSVNVIFSAMHLVTSVQNFADKQGQIYHKPMYLLISIILLILWSTATILLLPIIRKQRFPENQEK